MVSNEDKWVRIFDIPEISKHKKGFTIYKIISMVYPKNCPDSVTKVIVWKRYNDFKKLHRNIKAQYKRLKLKTKFPSLSSATYFNRFDEDVIQQRCDNIVRVLEFIAAQPELFSSDICVKFFKTSYTPNDLQDGNIHSIRAELNLPVELDYDPIRSYSDEEHTISDTDSVSTLSSTIDHLPDPLNLSSTASTIKLPRKSTSSSHDSLSITTNISLDGSMAITPPHTPSSISNPTLYIIEASHYISQAVDFEIVKKYEEAFAAYKMGIDILLKNVRDDKDIERREMVRHKTEKYLLRAERIFNVHLSLESKTIRNYILMDEDIEKQDEQQTISDLYKYKVLKVVSSGMLVLHLESQQLFYVKVIHKPTKCLNDKLMLPGNVPYMVKLCNYYNCENSVFLVLQYCSGIKLVDYLRQKSLNSESVLNYNANSSFLLDDDVYIEDRDSNSDSDHSYTDLISNYQFNRSLKASSTSSTTESQNEQAQNVLFSENHIEQLGNSLEESKDLISSVKSLQGSAELRTDKLGGSHTNAPSMTKSTKSSRASSERSESSLLDDFCLTESILPLADIVRWSAQLLLALERLHALGVICCNLQMKNLLINNSGDLFLTYKCNAFQNEGVAFDLKDSFVLAPEMYNCERITEAVDWWSYGAILYEMVVGMSLKSLHPEGLSSHTVLKIPKYVTVEARSLLKQLLIYDPHRRLGHGINGAEDIKSHPFFSSICWKDLVSKYKGD